MAFAFQGFGFGEFFKAKEKLQNLLEACFLGVFDAPSNFLSLARTLERLADGIEHLFDENSNPNSAILRSDNRQNAQQMLRIASHGLMDCLRDLETALPIEESTHQKPELRGYNMVLSMRLAGEEDIFDALTEKFAFQAWKLELFFKVLRKSKVSQTLQVYDEVQKRLDSFLQSVSERKSTTSSNDTQSSLGESEASFPGAAATVVQRLQDACQFGSSGANSKFVWKLKPESTLLITLHWVFQLSQHNDPQTMPVEAYVSLMKCAWILNISSPEPGVAGFSDEMCTMIGLLGCEVVYRLQDYLEKELDPPTTLELAERGDFRIFVEGVNKELGAGVMRRMRPAPLPSASPVRPPTSVPRSMYTPTSHDPSSLENVLDAVEDAYRDDRSYPGSEFEHPYSGSRDGSFHLPLRRSIPRSSTCSARSVNSSNDEDFAYGHSPADSDSPLDPLPREGRRRSAGLSMSDPYPGFPLRGDSSAHGTVPPAVLGATLQPRDVHKEFPKKSLQTYSWNEMVDRQNLGVRPGETEILPKEFELMHLAASYTGDIHGRWDDCRLRIFKYTSDCTLLRILTLMEGLDESIDQRIAYVKEAELVPDYGYNENHPVIYIRKTHRKNPFIQANQPKAPKAMPASSLFYRFRSAHDMFNFQLALLGETVETDFQAVRTVRYQKRNSDREPVHYKARIQFWREQDSEKNEILSSVPSVAPTVASIARQTPKVKIHSTRLIMYWEQSITALFVTDSVDVKLKPHKCAVKIRPSAHKAMNNPKWVKARAFGSREQPGGFRLDKKGLFPEDEESFDDYKWFELEFNHQEEMAGFHAEFRRALNIRRKERCHAEELIRLAARGIMAGQPAQR